MVERMKIGDVCNIERGVRVVKKDLVETGGIPVYQNSLTPLGYYDRSNNSGKIPFVIVGGAAGEVGYSDIPFWAADDCLCINNGEKMNGRFVYFFLSGKQIYLKSQVRKAGVPRLSRTVIEKLTIPVPSIAEQTRIVNILDTFIASIDNLKQQIAQRRKQYEHYRDQLLDLEGKEGAEMKTLGEVCDIKGRIGFRGYTRKDQVSKGQGAISLSPSNIVDGKMCYDSCTYITWAKYEESPEIMIDEGDVILCKTASVGKVAHIDKIPEKATINPQLVVLKKLKIDSKYLNYTLQKHSIQATFKALAGVGSVPNISQAKLSSLIIPVPSIAEQQRIVSILDTFEQSINNLEDQLAQREKQYEFYRNKLLTFE